MRANEIRVFCQCGTEMTLEEFDEGKRWYCDGCYRVIHITDNQLETLE